MPTVPHSTRPKWLPERVAHDRRTRTNNDVYQTKRWRNMAKRHKMLNPLCAECEQEGIVSPTTVTDHITPINQGGDPWALSNLQALCGACHASKSGREAHHKAGGESKT